MSRMSFSRQPSRDYNIISNQESTPAPCSLPKVSLHKPSFSLSRSQKSSTHVNRSHYDFNIITARVLDGPNSLPFADPAKTSNKKSFLISKYLEDTGLSSMRFRDGYEGYSSNKRFNRKKGMVDQFMGNEVSSINGWMKRH